MYDYKVPVLDTDILIVKVMFYTCHQPQLLMRLRWEGVFRAPELEISLDNIAKPNCLLGVKFVILVGFVELI